MTKFMEVAESIGGVGIPGIHAKKIPESTSDAHGVSFQ